MYPAIHPSSTAQWQDLQQHRPPRNITMEPLPNPFHRAAFQHVSRAWNRMRERAHAHTRKGSMLLPPGEAAPAEQVRAAAAGHYPLGL